MKPSKADNSTDSHSPPKAMTPSRPLSEWLSGEQSVCDEIRELCAKELGWLEPSHPDCMKFKVGWTCPHGWWMNPKGVLKLTPDIPDFPTDLNASRSLREALSDEEWDGFESNLEFIIGESNGAFPVLRRHLLNASPIAISTCFLLTRGRIAVA